MTSKTLLSDVFEFNTVAEEATRIKRDWDSRHPGTPQHRDALIRCLMIELNAALPEGLSIDAPDAIHITGDHTGLPSGWQGDAFMAYAMPAEAEGPGWDYQTYMAITTEQHVKAWQAQGNDGYPPRTLDQGYPPLLPGSTLIHSTAPTIEDLVDPGPGTISIDLTYAQANAFYKVFRTVLDTEHPDIHDQRISTADFTTLAPVAARISAADPRTIHLVYETPRPLDENGALTEDLPPNHRELITREDSLKADHLLEDGDLYIPMGALGHYSVDDPQASPAVRYINTYGINMPHRKGLHLAVTPGTGKGSYIASVDHIAHRNCEQCKPLWTTRTTEATTLNEDDMLYALTTWRIDDQGRKLRVLVHAGDIPAAKDQDQP